MELYSLNAEPRDDVGKGASRRLRKSGKVPGIVYGAKKDALSILLNHDEVIHQLENEAFYSHILTINIGKDAEKVVLKDLQRHPHKPSIIHIDFQRIDEKQKLTMRVPLHFINEDQCVGVKTGGGVIGHIMTELEISCLPKDLPEYIDVDMKEIDVGDTVILSDLQMPEGVEIYALTHGGDASMPVASVNIPKEIEEEVPEELEEIAEGAVPTVDETEEPAPEPDQEQE